MEKADIIQILTEMLEDEAKGEQEYAELASQLEEMGLIKESRVLYEMADDEGDHHDSLVEMIDMLKK